MAVTDVATSEPKAGILERLDELYEFERQPVTAENLQPGSYFAAVFGGEHIAGTEFVIGALFVQIGATVHDVVVGLLIGNLLAVLSWALVCCPIAVQTRLTLYWYLRKIAGPVVTAIYNVLNALLFCVLAGAMITVASSAVRIPFGIKPETNWVPSDGKFVLVVLGVGAVVVTLAILGFKRLAQFSSVCSPWMVIMFIVGAVAALPILGDVHSPASFWNLAEQQIWKGPAGVAHPLGFWHIVAFAWICNLATHLGLSDMALFRFARRPTYGFYSAFGMYLGHYLSWICAGILGAAAEVALQTSLAKLDPGEVATSILGGVGAATVVAAGWTTANPTLYRAGLALQVVSPGWPRWLVTLLAGTITTILACFPWVFLKLLDFVAIYGILLAPVGAIVIAEHWIFPRIGLAQYWSARKGQLVNWPALASWTIALVMTACVWTAKKVWDYEIIHEFFLAIPVWIVTTASYIGFAWLAGAAKPLPGLPPEPKPAWRPEMKAEVAPGAVRLSLFETLFLWLSGIAAAAALAAWILPGALDVWRLGDQTTEEALGFIPPVLGWTQIAFYVSAAIWLHLWEKSLPRNGTLLATSGLIAVVSLALCLVFAIAMFEGWMTRDQLKSHLILLTIMYFFSGVTWARQQEKKTRPTTV